MLQVSLDGGVTYVDAPEGARVILTDVDEDGREMHVVVTAEGVITDVWEKDVADVFSTACYPIDLLVENCE